MGFDTSGFIENALDKTKSLIGSPIGAGATGAVVGAATLGTALAIGAKVKTSRRKTSKKRKSRRKIKRTSRGKHKHRSSPRGKLTRHTHRRTKGIHYTSKGQPYIIMASGKARFIKKSGAKRSKKLKGGRY